MLYGTPFMICGLSFSIHRRPLDKKKSHSSSATSMIGLTFPQTLRRTHSMWSCRSSHPQGSCTPADIPQQPCVVCVWYVWCVCVCVVCGVCVCVCVCVCVWYVCGVWYVCSVWCVCVWYVWCVCVCGMWCVWYVVCVCVVCVVCVCLIVVCMCMCVCVY